ncbi:MAG: bifunctional phosphoserine phosphatase/homoserine phosphotransferase ThrH [Candidatus Omnitrophota bacterium]
MNVCCLDLEGVLLPEIWINVAEKTKIKELRLTTRDIPDYDVLMRRRLKILRERHIKLRDVQAVIARMDPLPGAKAFLDRLRSEREVIILSDTFYEFAMPLIRKLGSPTLWCNWLSVDGQGYIKDYRLRQRNGKEKAVRALKQLGFRVKAAGDSFNDLTMLRAADEGILFKPPAHIEKEYSHFKVTKNYPQLLKALLR